MTWLDRIEQISTATVTAVIGAVMAGAWWIIRTFFTDRVRLSLLEKEMQDRISRHDDLRADVTRQFDKVDEKLTSIQDVLMKGNGK